MYGNKLLPIFVGALALTIVLGGCEEPDERRRDWDTIHAAVIAPSCATAGCHSSLARTAGVVLEDADDAYNFLVTQEGFIVPFDTNSPLIFLLEGDERTQMPPDGPIPRANVEWIQDWIAEGAVR